MRGNRAVAALLLAAILLLSCGEPVAPPPIVLIVIDTLRADFLGCYGFRGPSSPNLDDLAQESLRFTRAYAPAPWTKPSMASLWTGLVALGHGVTNHEGRMWGDATEAMTKGVLPADRVTLAQRLRERGYRTAGFVANPWITAEYGFDRGFETYREVLGTPKARADSVLAFAEEWLQARRPNEPWFLYVHLMDVHGPYDAPEAFYETIRSSGAADTLVRLSRLDVNQAPLYLRSLRWVEGMDQHDLGVWRARYAAGVRSVDREVGGLIDRLREQGWLDRAHVVVTSDHGEELFDHGGWDHGKALHEELVRIPLLIRPPGGLGAPGRHDGVVSLIDLLPTLLNWAGADPIPDTDARDLTPILGDPTHLVPREAVLGAVRGGPEEIGMVMGSHKILYHAEDQETRLFDLDRDPREQRDLAREEPELAAALRDRLLAILAARSDLPLFRIPGDPQERPAREELLRSLGYID